MHPYDVAGTCRTRPFQNDTIGPLDRMPALAATFTVIVPAPLAIASGGQVYLGLPPAFPFVAL